MPKIHTFGILLGVAVPQTLKKGEIKIVQMLLGGLILGNLLSIWHKDPELAEVFNRTYVPVLMAVLCYFFGKEESEV